VGRRAQSDWYRRRRVPVWPLALVVTVGLGLWGFADLQWGSSTPQPLSPVDVVYRTLRLFALEFDLPPGASAPWQLWVAALAAPILTLRGIARLFREQLSGVLAHYFVRPRVVILGANERAAALVTSSPRPGRWRDAIVVVDPDPAALASVTAPRVWTVRRRVATAASLRQVAIPRAANLVVVTGDNGQNSAITTAVLDLQPPPSLDLYVEVEEPGLARTLEQGGYRVGLEIVPFSASALGAAAALDELEGRRRQQRRPSLLGLDEDGAGPTLALFGTGELVDAVVLELHHRRQVQLLDEPDTADVRPRIVLFGPDASRRRRSLATLVGTELQLLDLDSLDVRLDQVVELDIETARHLARTYPLRQVFVLAPTDLDGGGIAITLARHLGPESTVVLITESASTPFGDEIEEQSRVSPTLGEVLLYRVPEHAYELPALQAQRLADRLGRAIHAAEDPPEEPGAWAALAAEQRADYRARARQHVAAAAVPLRRSALVAPAPAETPLLEALGFERPTTLARAGLRVDFQSVASLLPAAEQLLARGHDAAFGAWCEFARLQTKPDQLIRDLPVGPGAADVRELLLLRRAQLGDPDALMTIRATADGPAASIVVLAGAKDDVESSITLLQPTLGDGVSVVAPAGGLREALGAVEGRALPVWRSIIAAGDAKARVVALPAAAAEDIMLARALGATIGRVEQPGAPDLSRTLLNGGVGVVPLPYDRMTVRAFLRPGNWPRSLAALREPMAAELHWRYVTRQRTRKLSDDPALQPWSALSPWLQRSNLAVVDDIPTKLAAVGLRLDETAGDGTAAELADLVQSHIELLAELEHGRYTAERLLAGWTSGVRDPARFLSPYLQPWAEVSDEVKEYDREAVRDIPAVLAAHGLGVRRLD
jgi:RyR domain/TrkA-N domain